jgi:hypothetical protein
MGLRCFSIKLPKACGSGRALKASSPSLLIGSLLSGSELRITLPNLYIRRASERSSTCTERSHVTHCNSHEQRSSTPACISECESCLILENKFHLCKSWGPLVHILDSYILGRFVSSDLHTACHAQVEDHRITFAGVHYCPKELPFPLKAGYHVALQCVSDLLGTPALKHLCTASVSEIPDAG